MPLLVLSPPLPPRYRTFFYGQAGGAFVEVGAVADNGAEGTLALAPLLGWVGGVVTPSPSLFAQVTRHHPTDTVVHSAVCAQPQVCAPSPPPRALRDWRQP